MNEREALPPDARNTTDDTKIEVQIVSDEEVERVLLGVDAESNFRRLSGAWAQIIRWIAIGMSLFHLYTALFGVLPAQLQRTWHLMFALCLVFLLYPSNRKKKGALRSIAWTDLVLAALGVLVNLYWIFDYRNILMRAGDLTRMDRLVGGLAIILVLEAARRIVGLPITIIGSVFLAYGHMGKFTPGFLMHRGFSIERIIGHMFFTTEGILGIPLHVSSTFVFLFILFGVFLEKTGIGQFIIDIANAAAGKAAGGPAKVAVIASALEGTVSGSSVANVVGSGSYTIPLMKRIGYKPEFAGAVEAAASTGGQIMPPVMGAAAFLMSEFIGLEYRKIALAAVVPALLYFTGVFFGVHLEARKSGLRGLTDENVPRFWRVMRERGHLLLPIFSLIGVMAMGYTPVRSALFSIGLALLLTSLSPKTRLGFKDLLDALEQAARSALGVAAATACAGIIVGTVTLTGLGLKMANGLVTLAGGSLLLTMFFSMIASLILGMGTPTTANYVITSTIASPALIQMGVPVLAAHMFVFYFGIVADCTPPVALAAYAGAGIAKANPMRTAINATKLAIGAFLVPYIFVLSPQMLLIDVTLAGLMRLIAGAMIGMLALEAAVEQWLLTDTTVLESIVLAAAGLLLIDPGILTDMIGLGLFLTVYLFQMKRAKALGVRYLL